MHVWQAASSRSYLPQFGAEHGLCFCVLSNLCHLGSSCAGKQGAGFPEYVFAQHNRVPCCGSAAGAVRCLFLPRPLGEAAGNATGVEAPPEPSCGWPTLSGRVLKARLESAPSLEAWGHLRDMFRVAPERVSLKKGQRWLTKQQVLRSIGKCRHMGQYTAGRFWTFYRAAARYPGAWRPQTSWKHA